MKLAILSLLLIVPLAASVKLNCAYGSLSYWAYIGNAYQCLVSNMAITAENTAIDSLEGTHAEGKSNADVLVLYIGAPSVCSYMPKGIELFFNNLEIIFIQNAGLKALTKGDLKPFPDLKILGLIGNNLKALEPDMLIWNTHLKYIDISDNQIETVPADIFEHNKDLEVAIFKGNKCISKDGLGIYKVKEVLKEITEKCAAGGTKVISVEDKKFAVSV